MSVLAELQRFEEVKGPKEGWKEIFSTQIQGQVQFEESLKKYTSLKVGGPAELLAKPADQEDLKKLISLCEEYQVPWTILGKGSNVIIKDGGIRGVVLVLDDGFKSLECIEEHDEFMRLQVGAAYPLPKLVEFARSRALEGVQYLFGIPASVGGALRMNAGTKKGEIKDIVEEVHLMDRNGELATLKGKRLHFSYRHLKLNPKTIILSGVFKLYKGDAEKINRELQSYRQYRFETQPLDLPSLGSVFKNPEHEFAAELIEEAGLKDVRVGGARISNKHSNWIVNEGQASAKDVLALVNLMKDKVKEKFDIVIELEAKVLGSDVDES